MRAIEHIAFAALVVAVGGHAPLASQTEDQMKPGPTHTTRLEIGKLPPTSFALSSAADGALFDLAAQRGERPILLLFFRGTW